MNYTEYLSIFVSLFAITNIFGNLIIFITLTHDRKPTAIKKIAITTAFSVLITLIISCWGGNEILHLFGIKQEDFAIAGGVIIFFIGMNLLRSQKTNKLPTKKEEKEIEHKSSIAVVPLAIPIIAGPGAITTILIAAQKYSTIGQKLELTSICLIISAIILIVLLSAHHIRRLAGDIGLNILSRIMGMLLVAMAFGMMIQGLQTAFPGWTH